MERKIGEIFEYNGEWYQCVESQDRSCKHCDMNFESKCPIPIKECTESGRSDKSYVIFKKLEKVGEPFSCDYFGDKRLVIMQEYQLYEANAIYNYGSPPMYISDYKHKRIAIEIKQNKEDKEEKAIKIKMENIKVGNKVICLSNSKPYVITEANCRMEYNGDWHDCVIYTPLYYNPFKCFVRPIEDFAQNFVLDSVEEKEERHSNLENIGKNLKPFDLEAAKAGKPVCTRDGRKARIICFDRISGDDYYKIVACVTAFDGDFEEVLFYGIDGYIVNSQNQKDEDLMMLPEKKEGWINVKKDASLFKSREEAERNCTKDYASVRVEFEI